MSLSAKFEELAEKVRGKPPTERADQEALYGLFKQAKEGDAKDEDCPYVFNVTARAKWDAWAKHKGTSKDAAMQQYIDFAEKYLARA